MHTHKRLLALVLIHAMVNLCNGSNAVPQEPMQWIVQWDNDLLTGTDRDYTNGARIAFLQELAPNTVLDNRLRKWLYPLLGAQETSQSSALRLPGRDKPRFAWGIGITQLMFTPDDPNALQAPAGERPYAGWLGLEASLHAKTERSVNSVTLVIGTTGQPSYARDTQNWMHKNVSNSPLYQGWDSQVPAEPTINLQFDHKLRLPSRNFDALLPGLSVDGYGEWGIGLGNFRTDAYVGMLLRGGYNLPAHFTVPRVQLGSYGHRFFRDKPEAPSPWSFIGFTGVRGIGVAHDITLDGPVFRSFDTGVQRKPLVGELLFGFGVRFREIELTVSRSVRSKEFRNQSSNQQFGSVMLRLNAPF
jgi:lipid A 3-O-deacylase